MQRFVIASVALAAAFSAAALAAPASIRVQGAAPNGTSSYAVRAIAVQYDDSELTTSEGATAVLARVSKAAEQVCSVRNAHFGMADQIARCQRDAIKYAVASVNSPALTQAVVTK